MLGSTSNRAGWHLHPGLCRNDASPPGLSGWDGQLGGCDRKRHQEHGLVGRALPQLYIQRYACGLCDPALGKAAKTEALVSILASIRRASCCTTVPDPHAVLLTDYTDGVFYCSDPSNGVASGRVPLSAASISIGGASCYWYITEDGNDDGLELLEEAVQAEEAAAETETAAETEAAAGEESSSQDWWTSLFG